ncbi:hypothetical protein, partial [Escherichia coli]|uniref:hypothetical protein n=1 Tax=Escherichia coli TaxID=562 RepID=UPI001F20EE92
PLNARLMLDNGEIVRSTVPNNTTNPNIDMTGWQNDSKALKSFLDNIVTPEMFGNNIIAAADFAISSGGVLFTSNRVYEVSQEFKVPANTVW